MNDDLPPLPKGAVLNAPDATPPLPKGAVLDTSSAPPDVKTTIGGIAGAATRGAAPYAAGAAIGAAAGAPFGGVGAAPGALAGLGAVGLTELSEGIYNTVADALHGPHAITPREITDKILDKLGVPRAKTGVERTVESATEGAASAYGGAGMAKTLSGMTASPLLKNILTELGQKQEKQAVAGAVSGVTGQLATEAGGGPITRFFASMLGGGAPFVREGAASLARSDVKDATRTAGDAGFVIPPAMAGDKPSLTSKTLGAMSGQIKTNQQASAMNQGRANELAAEDIGLPKDTALTPDALEPVRLKEGAAYQAVIDAVPEVSLDKTFLDEVKGLGGKNAQAQQYFSELIRNPHIDQLKTALQKNESVPTAAMVELVRKLRFDSKGNLQAPGDPGKWELGLAQRHAAESLDDLLDRNISDAPKYFSRKFDDAIDLEKTTTDFITRTQQSINNAMGNNEDSIIIGRSIYPLGQARAFVAEAKSVLKQAGDDRGRWSKALQQSRSRQGDLAQLVDRYRAARQVIAKTHDIEAATNPVTGDVNALGLKALSAKGKPLSGGLKTIADSAAAFPKAFQNPAQFGGVHDWSALDFFGAASAVVAGHPEVGFGILGRPVARRTILTQGYQGAMRSPKTGVPLSVVAPAGTVGREQERDKPVPASVKQLVDRAMAGQQ